MSGCDTVWLCSDGDIDVAAESRTGSSTAELEGMTPAPEETVIADEADTTWAVQDDYTPGGRYSWIFASDDDIITTPTAQSAVLGALLAGLYHTRVSVVSACLVQLERLIHAGWFTKGVLLCTIIRYLCFPCHASQLLS